MKHIDFTLPEFAFLDGNSHLGDTLEDRTVVMHIRSHTVMEVLVMDEMAITNLNQDAKIYNFDYVNKMAIIEPHAFVVHYTLAEDFQLRDVFEKSRAWYCDYLTWEDNNILNHE